MPLFTFGAGTFVMVLIGGIWLRARRHIVAAAIYFLLLVYFFVAVQYTPSNGGRFPDAAVMPAFLAMWLGGVAHVVALQMIIQRRAAAPAPAPVPEDPALVAAERRAARRDEARAILASKPALAAELRIGRPDLAREYDDGGLVDVNHVPAAVLATQLDLPESLAESVVAERDRVGGFSSPDELIVYCDGMTPERMTIIQDRLAFVPL